MPQFSLRGTVRADGLLDLRERLGAAGTPVSVTALLVKAAARAHTIVPELNVTWGADSVRHHHGVDIGVAVATERGLLTPVLRDVDRRSVTDLAAGLGELATRAAAGTLRQAELEGGTLTVTNLGMFGTEEFTAIINPPQSAILAVGAARAEPLVHGKSVAVGTVIRVTLSVDHRPVDGVTAAKWLRAFVATVEDPLRILA